MTDRELMQQALDALKFMRPACFAETTLKAADTSIVALRERLEQPEQEPVAWMTINEYGEEDDIHYECPEGHLLDGWTYKPLYTHPPTAQPEKEPLEYWNAVEGWVKIDEVREHFESVNCGTIYKKPGEGRVPLYAAPPQRPWVGLTDEEIKSLPSWWPSYEDAPALIELVKDVEAKLREKNGG
jgi:hypothetical protein